MTAARKTLTKRTVDSMQPGKTDAYCWDGDVAGFGVKVTPAGRRVFLFQYRFPASREGRTYRLTIGTSTEFTVDQARDKAKMAVGKLSDGINPFAQYVDKAKAEAAAQAAAKAEERARKAKTFKAQADQFLKLYVRPHLRSADEYERILNKYVIPKWGSKPMSQIQRGMVTELLDEIAVDNGGSMADYTLAVIRKLFSWYAVRNEEFKSPVVAGLRPRTSKPRARVLTDDEIRAVWKATADTDPMSRLVRFLLLTAQRRNEAAGAHRSEISDGVWTIPAARYKTRHDNVVPLTEAARWAIGTAPHDGEFVFGFDGSNPWTTFSVPKRELDKRSGVKGWRLHDLRRTARTLMVRGGVRPDIAERVLGHVIPGVAGIYDRHDYVVEKRHALDVLASEIARIISEERDPKVVPMRRGHHSRP